MSPQEQHSTAPWRLETEHFQDGEAEPVEWEQPRTLWTGWDEKEHRQRYTRARFNSPGFSREGAALAMADARIIAAAPAMLKALEAFMSTTHSHLEAFDARRLAGPILAQARPIVAGQEQNDG